MHTYIHTYVRTYIHTHIHYIYVCVVPPEIIHSGSDSLPILRLCFPQLFLLKEAL